jgi:hypothetical protein
MKKGFQKKVKLFAITNSAIGEVSK